MLPARRGRAAPSLPLPGRPAQRSAPQLRQAGAGSEVNVMAPIANEAPTPIAMIGSWMKCAAMMPIIAEIVLPPTIDHGCAKGLAGTAKRRTAEAPIGATISSRVRALAEEVTADHTGQRDRDQCAEAGKHALA